MAEMDLIMVRDGLFVIGTDYNVVIRTHYTVVIRANNRTIHTLTQLRNPPQSLECKLFQPHVSRYRNGIRPREHRPKEPSRARVIHNSYGEGRSSN